MGKIAVVAEVLPKISPHDVTNSESVPDCLAFFSRAADLRQNFFHVSLSQKLRAARYVKGPAVTGMRR